MMTAHEFIFLRFLREIRYGIFLNVYWAIKGLKLWYTFTKNYSGLI